MGKSKAVGLLENTFLLKSVTMQHIKMKIKYCSTPKQERNNAKI
jgi:hypothetical protein